MKKILIGVLILFAIILFVSIYDITLCQFRKDLIVNLMGSLLAGILLTLILFALKEYVFKINLSGEWEVVEVIEETTYLPYKGFKLFYTFHILQKGTELIGTGEKIKQIESEEITTVFEVTKRTRVEFEGYIEKGYLTKTKIYFLLHDFGRIRESSTTYTLTVNNKSFLNGIFKSTAANAKGPVIMKKV